jgi:predicted HD superfamily hydrolase involved in NAD metabolism
MMTLDEARIRLEEVLTPKRFKHSLNVMNTAAELAVKYEVDVVRAEYAGLLHDCGKNLEAGELLSICRKYGLPVDNVSSAQPELLHGAVGAVLARHEYGVQDESILTAIKYHTTGREGMDMLEKIIFIADFIEPGRTFPEAEEARKVAFVDIDKAILIALDRTIEFVLKKGALMHADTVFARNYIISSLKSKELPTVRCQ